MPFSQVYGVTKPENNRDPELFKQILAAVAVPEFVPKVRALPPVPNSLRDSTITCDSCEPASDRHGLNLVKMAVTGLSRME